jgi:hypothetical protein
MDADRADRLVSELQARGVMAHPDRIGVYESGIRVVLDANLEALWDVDGVAGLDAEIVSDGVLVGFVPHVPGSEDFTDQQIVDSIVTTRYTVDGLHPPTDGTGDRQPGTAGPPAHPTPATPQPPDRRHRWTDHLGRGRGRHR